MIALLFLALLPALHAQEKPSAPETKPETGAYILQRGDTIEIKVFNVAELDSTVTIRPDGKISVMLLDDVQAAGLTPARLDEILTTGYAPFYLDPKVTINVKSFSNLKVYVGGEVGQPGLFALLGEMTAGRAVIQAGGLKGTAKPEHALLLRNSGQGTPVSTRVDLKEVFRGAKPDIALMPFDVIFVPKSRIAKVDDFVDRFIRQMIPISLSAGFSYLLNNPFPGVER